MSTSSTNRGATIWLTGLSGAGKSTIAEALVPRLREAGHRVDILDGDEVRQVLTADLGFSREDRITNVRRIGYVAEVLSRNGVLTLVPVIAPYAEAELHLDPDGLVDPYGAAIASAIAFVVGALLPLLAITLPPTSARVPVAVVATLLALSLTGFVSARVGGGHAGRAVRRVLLGGSVGLAITYFIGQLTGAAVN